MHYAIGDVHGCYDQMLEIIDKIKSQDGDARFIFVGDFVDRGPKVWETLDWCLEHIDTSGDPEAEYRSVLGNHEDMLIDWYEEWVKRIEWGSKFIPTTNYDFDYRLADRHYSKPEDVKKYIDFFKQLPLYIDVETNGEKFKIVHSWFPPDKYVSPRQIREWYVWDRFYHYGGNYCDESFTVIHGHTPTICDYHREEDVPGEIIYRTRNINIDGGCVFNRRFDPLERTNLCGYCLETGKEFYVEGPDPDDWRIEID